MTAIRQRAVQTGCQQSQITSSDLLQGNAAMVQRESTPKNGPGAEADDCALLGEVESKPAPFEKPRAKGCGTRHPGKSFGRGTRKIICDLPGRAK
jgi:hypothetical protein